MKMFDVKYHFGGSYYQLRFHVSSEEEAMKMPEEPDDELRPVIQRVMTAEGRLPHIA